MAAGEAARRPDPRYTLRPGRISTGVPGWELEGDVVASHPRFDADDSDQDVEGAMVWAEGLIGARQDWRHRRVDGADRWEAGALPHYDIPDIQTHGAAYKMSVQTDARGAVLVAYTRDATTGAVTRSHIRIDPAGVDYIRHRLAPAAPARTATT
ncbi:hypothetical protein [Streptomyces sp. NPDC058621]|uniref:hypothetical protein n=1 Tax=Streptomyces sp. NPDC058621 TaxID=3346561 RepID=UPI00365B9586